MKAVRVTTVSAVPAMAAPPRPPPTARLYAFASARCLRASGGGAFFGALCVRPTHDRHRSRKIRPLQSWLCAEVALPWC